MRTATDRAEAQNFASDLFPKLKAWRDFLYRERDSYNENLVYIRHPWSSGQDNAPIWDEVLKRMDLDEHEIPTYSRTDTNDAERPSDENYNRYIYLVDFFRWRDPIWINLNWLLFRGFNRHGYSQYSRFIKRSIIELCKRSGFHEYYNPDDGRGYGAPRFS